MAPPHVPATSDGSAQQPASKQSQDSKKSGKKSEGPFKRKRTGCVTCRSRKIRCDERKPDCLNCEKSKRECVWEEGSIWKHDQNPSVPNRRETKFYRTAPNEFAREDERRLNTAAPRSEYQFVNNFGNPASATSVRTPAANAPSMAMQHGDYQQVDPHNLQALASAATYQNAQIPPSTYNDNGGHLTSPRSYDHASSVPNAAIDPNLEAAPPSLLDGITEHASATVEHEDDVDARVAQMLKAAEADTSFADRDDDVEARMAQMLKAVDQHGSPV